MARISFLTDEHMAKAVSWGLRARGIDAITVAEAGLLGSADDAVLAHAARGGRVLITSDADFLRLHANGISHAGIIYARFVPLRPTGPTRSYHLHPDGNRIALALAPEAGTKSARTASCSCSTSSTSSAASHRHPDEV